MIRILHSSDLHGNYRKLIVDHAESEFDVWIDTGDFFPTFGRKHGERISSRAEQSFQSKWWGYKTLGVRIREWLRGRPGLVVPGNHDFVNLAKRLHLAGALVQEVTPQGVELFGRKWAGFREIPYMEGEWEGECHDFTAVIGHVVDANPDVLLTHAPPLGILDSEEGQHEGIPGLLEAASRTKTKLHLFGHIHAHGGYTMEQANIIHVNGATFARVYHPTMI